MACVSLLLSGLFLFVYGEIRGEIRGRKSRAETPAAIVDSSGNVPSGNEPGQEMTLPLGDSGVNMTFCWCPPGTFQRGSNDYDNDETTVREITISKGFWMAKYETTQAQWNAAGFTNESTWKDETLLAFVSGSVVKHKPVENVSHTKAVAFANKLKQLSGKSVRLPTEAEWEYACRAGTPAGQKYWSGNTEEDLKRVGWYGGNSGSKTHPVGEKNAPNPWGLHDMHGNVCEWCADWYDAGYYKESKDSPSSDPECKDSKQEYRVLRGGSWDGDPVSCRAAYRYGSGTPAYRGLVGFRVCVVLN